MWIGEKHGNADCFHFKFITTHLLWVLRMPLRSFYTSLAPPLLGISLRTLSPPILSPQLYENNILISHHQSHQYSCNISQCFSSVTVNELFLLILKVKYFPCTLDTTLSEILKELCSWNFTSLFPANQLPSVTIFWSVHILVEMPLILTVSFTLHPPHTCFSFPL